MEADTLSTTSTTGSMAPRKEALQGLIDHLVTAADRRRSGSSAAGRGAITAPTATSISSSSPNRAPSGAATTTNSSTGRRAARASDATWCLSATTISRRLRHSTPRWWRSSSTRDGRSTRRAREPPFASNETHSGVFGPRRTRIEGPAKFYCRSPAERRIRHSNQSKTAPRGDRSRGQAGRDYPQHSRTGRSDRPSTRTSPTLPGAGRSEFRGDPLRYPTGSGGLAVPPTSDELRITIVPFKP